MKPFTPQSRVNSLDGFESEVVVDLIKVTNGRKG